MNRAWVEGYKLPPFRDYLQEFEPIFGAKRSKMSLNPMLKRDTTFMLSDNFMEDREGMHQKAELLARTTMKTMWDSWWLYTVRTIWLKRRFYAKKKGAFHRLLTHLPSICPDQYYQYSKYRQVAVKIYGHYLDFFSLRWLAYAASFIPDWYPGFDDVDPFTEEGAARFKWPFTYVGPDMAGLVIGIEERLALLEVAEQRKMDYFEFTDYVVNWVQSHNEAINKRKYEYRAGDYREPPIVGNMVLKTLAYCAHRFIVGSETWGPDPDWLNKVPVEVINHFKTFRTRMSTRQKALTVKPVK